MLIVVLKVNGEKVEVSDKEIEDAVTRIQNMYAKFEPVKEKRPVKKGDYVICDVEAFSEGKAITKKHENMWIEANKEASMLGMGENLIGLNTGI